MKHCSYDLIACMDMYGVAKPGRFEKQIAVFCAHLDMDVVGTWIDEFEGSIENVISVRKLPEKHWKILKYARLRCPENHPVTMFRKETVMKLGDIFIFLCLRIIIFGYGC